MVGCSENIISFLTNFDDKILAHFCTLLAGGFFITPLFLSQWIEIEEAQQ